MGCVQPAALDVIQHVEHVAGTSALVADRRRRGQEFKVVIRKTTGQTLGLTFTDGPTPEILAVSSGDLVQQWNKGHPELAVKPGDFIVEVNGIRDDTNQMVDECRRAKTLELVVRRSQFGSEYELCETLGTGSFGVVKSAREKTSGRTEAVKIIDAGGGRPTTSSGKLDYAAVKEKLMLAMQEVQVWRAVGSHSNVVKLHKSFCDGSAVFMVMEKCECTVEEKVASHPDLLQSRLPHLLHQMLLGVEACHAASVTHRDIKPANYLIALDGSTVKLADFNLSAVLPSKQSLKGEVGTPPFMSPEMLTARHGMGTDVWSYGVMAYYMLFGELPYIPQDATPGAAKAAIQAGVPVPRYLEKVHRDRSRDSMSLCRDLLQRDPSQRCSARDALGHSYFQTAFDAK